MPLKGSTDFGAKLFAGRGRAVDPRSSVPGSQHRYHLVARDGRCDRRPIRSSCRSACASISLGCAKAERSRGRLHAPLRPEVPALKPASTYLLETVIRTLKLGHLFTQGTTDSNEVWLEVTVTSGDRVIGHSGRMDQRSRGGSWAHFVNVFMLDREGQSDQSPQRPGYLRAALQSPDPAGCRPDRPLLAAGAGRRHRADPVAVAAEVSASSTASTWISWRGNSRTRGRMAPLRGQQPGAPVSRINLPVTVLAEDEVVFPIGGS